MPPRNAYPPGSDGLAPRVAVGKIRPPPQAEILAAIANMADDGTCAPLATPAGPGCTCAAPTSIGPDGGRCTACGAARAVASFADTCQRAEDAIRYPGGKP